MGGWMDRWIGRHMDEDGLTDGQDGKWKGGQMDEQIDGWMDGQMDRLMDGQTKWMKRWNGWMMGYGKMDMDKWMTG